jgi:xylulokinase
MASWAGGLALRWVVGLATGGKTTDAAMRRALGRLPAGDARAVADVDPRTSVAPLPGGLGAIAGLDLGVDHAGLVLAVLDGLANRLREATGELTRLGVRATRIRASGGGSRSDRWLQLKADATGLPVERVAVEEAGAFAAAVMAGSAVGVLPPADVAIGELATVERRFEPDAAAVGRHAERAERYRALADGVAMLTS